MIIFNLYISICVLTFLVWNFCDCLAIPHDTKSDLKIKKLVKYSSLQPVRPVLPIQNGDFASFRKKISKEIPGVTEQMLNSKEIQDFFNKEIKNKKFDLKDRTESNKVVSLLLSMLCSSCKGDCQCLQRLECAVSC